MREVMEPKPKDFLAAGCEGFGGFPTRLPSRLRRKLGSYLPRQFLLANPFQ